MDVMPALVAPQTASTPATALLSGAAASFAAIVDSLLAQSKTGEPLLPGIAATGGTARVPADDKTAPPAAANQTSVMSATIAAQATTTTQTGPQTGDVATPAAKGQPAQALPGAPITTGPQSIVTPVIPDPTPASQPPLGAIDGELRPASVPQKSAMVPPPMALATRATAKHRSNAEPTQATATTTSPMPQPANADLAPPPVALLGQATVAPIPDKQAADEPTAIQADGTAKPQAHGPVSYASNGTADAAVPTQTTPQMKPEEGPQIRHAETEDRRPADKAVAPQASVSTGIATDTAPAPDLAALATLSPHRTDAPSSSAALVAPAAPTSVTPPATQVGHAIVSLAQTNEGASMTIQLNPVELGTVHIRIDRPTDGDMQVAVTAERPDTLLMLVRDQDGLRHALAQAGLPATGGMVSYHIATPAPSARSEMNASGGGTFQQSASGNNSGNPDSAPRDDRAARSAWMAGRRGDAGIFYQPLPADGIDITA